MKHISPKTAYAEAKADPACVIVDVREIGEAQGTTIPGSIALPLTRFAEEFEILRGKKKIFFICASGRRSMMATEYLESQGFTNVSNVEGGVVAWNSEGLPIVG